ncbi:MAG: branched-chain amino acid ABC transporter permease [Thermodesulfobacteriota bacterium]|nr:branched-chain amino acid ABC transporter permease [Thermodesulfobacteriota bacterium]
MDYVFHLLILICIYVILTVSLNILVGFTGLFSLAQAAFFGIGAYASSLLGLKLGLSFWAATGIPILLAMLIGIVLALVTLRLGGDYFILAVLGFQMMISGVLYNWVSVTRGPFGLYGISNPSFLGISISSNLGYLFLYGLISLASYGIIHRLLVSPFGRVLKAIREDEIATLVLGKNIVHYKVIVFAISSGFAALAGSLHAHYFTTLHPVSFSLSESILIVTIVIIGGSGSLKGSVLGTILLILFPEALRFLNIPSEVAPPIQQMFYGFLLIFFMLFRPQGLVGEYKV